MSPEVDRGSGVAENNDFRQGQAVRKSVPRKTHGEWQAPQDRPDPIAVLEAQNASRLPELVPVRWGRMLESPFAFLRGSAAVMAMDLASTAVTGITVQACGDAHIANFGLFASPERNLLFDVNDFDETDRGAWEWDVKRLATSAVVAGRDAGLRLADQREAALGAARSYRRHMKRFSQMSLMDVWYSRVDAEAAVKFFGSSGAPIKKSVDSARRHTSDAALPGLTELVADGTRHIVDHPPLVTHSGIDDHRPALRALFEGYLASLDDAHVALMHRFEVVDFALKVVGVGSVGTRCFIALLQSDLGDSLLLQVKEAEKSVLAPFTASTLLPEGRRVVAGQRLMQAATDIFLGWATSDGVDYYVRQLRDMKGSINVAALDARAPSLTM